MSAYLAALRRSAGIDAQPLTSASAAGSDGDPFEAADVAVESTPVPAAGRADTSLALPVSVTEGSTAAAASDSAPTPASLPPPMPAWPDTSVQRSSPAPDAPAATTKAAGRQPAPSPAPPASTVATAPHLHAAVQAALRWVAADPAAQAAETPGRPLAPEIRLGEAVQARRVASFETDPTAPTAAVRAGTAMPVPARPVVLREAAPTTAPRGVTPGPPPQPLELHIGQIHLHLDAPAPPLAVPAPAAPRPAPTRDFSGSSPPAARGSLARARLRRL